MHGQQNIKISKLKTNKTQSGKNKHLKRRIWIPKRKKPKEEWFNSRHRKCY